MADEITIKAFLSYAKTGQVTVTRENTTSAGDTLTQKTGNFRYVNRVQNFSTSATAIGLGDVPNPGMCWMQNIGATNTLSIREGIGGAAVVFLEPGEWALFRMSGGAPFCISDAGTSDLEYFIIED